MPSWVNCLGAARVWPVAQLTYAVPETSQAGFRGARHLLVISFTETARDFADWSAAPGEFTKILVRVA